MLKDFAISIVRTLREKGHHAHLVGGCVRDLLLGREPADYDIATDATPDEVMRIFLKTSCACCGLCALLRVSNTKLRRLHLSLFKSWHRKSIESPGSGFAMSSVKCSLKAMRGGHSCCSMRPGCCMKFCRKLKP